MNQNKSNTQFSRQLILTSTIIVAVFIVIIGIIVFETSKLSRTTDLIKQLHMPSTQVAQKLTTGIYHSLASLRAWMILSEEQFKFERVKAWQQEIEPSLETMERLSRHWVNPQNIERLSEMKELLIELSVAQNQIESIANRIESIPARKIMIEELSPVGDSIANQITSMIDIESQLAASAERKITLKKMADFRGSFGLSLAALRLYVLTGNSSDRNAYESHWTINVKAFHQLIDNREEMSSQQQVIFNQLQRGWQQYNSLSNEVISSLNDNVHNIANKMLAEDAEPKAQAVLAILKQLHFDQSTRLEEDFHIHHGEIEELTQFVSVSVAVGILLVIGLGVGLARTMSVMNQSEIEQTLLIENTQSELQSVNKDLLLQVEFNRQMELISSSIQSHKKLDELCDGLILTLSTFVNACFGAIYLNQRIVLSQDKDAKERLLCYGRFGIGKEQGLQTIDFGESLVGQCAVSQQVLSYQHIPEDYPIVNSALGQSKSYHLLLVPIVFEQQTIGVIELASFTPLNQKQQQSLSNIAPNIAIGINNQVYIEQVQLLLKRSQEQSEILTEKSRHLEDKNLEIEQSQQLLAQRAEDLERSNRYKSEFLATMSHEIRTPMNGVIGMLELLEDSKLSKSQVKKVQMAQSSANSLLSIINDILDFSKIEAGKLELEAVDFNLYEFLEEFCEPLALKAHEKQIELVVDATAVEHPFVNGDPTRLRQIMTNLVANGIKFTGEGQVLMTVSTEKVHDMVTISCTVDDTGIGIAPEQQNALFEPFRQADASITRNYGGTGLGLSIVKKLVNEMNGQISLVQKSSPGSKFHFNVRFKFDNASQKISPEPKLDDVNILIIGSENGSRELIVKQLKQWQAHVSAKTVNQLLTEDLQDGEQALDLIIIDQIDSVDSDIVTLIRDIPEYAQVKLVALVDTTISHELYLSIEEAFDCIISKPIYRSNLINLFDLMTKQPLASFNNEQPKPTLSSTWPKESRVLLVEDNFINQEVAKAILEGLCLPFDVAANGQEAIDMLLQSQSDNPYSIILMDCQMPVMDGLTATKQIRSGEASSLYGDIPIIALTANAMVGDKESCLTAGMSDYLAKPIDPKLLKSMLDKWLC